MGNAAGTGVVGPQGKHCCRYCTALKAFIGNPDLSCHTTAPNLRDPHDYFLVVKKVDELRAKGYGFQGKADSLLKEHGYTEGLISFI